MDSIKQEKEAGLHIPQIMAGYRWTRNSRGEVHLMPLGFYSRVWQVEYDASEDFYARWYRVVKRLSKSTNS